MIAWDVWPVSVIPERLPNDTNPNRSIDPAGGEVSNLLPVTAAACPLERTCNNATCKAAKTTYATRTSWCDDCNPYQPEVGYCYVAAIAGASTWTLYCNTNWPSR